MVESWGNALHIIEIKLVFECDFLGGAWSEISAISGISFASFSFDDVRAMIVSGFDDVANGVPAL